MYKKGDKVRPLRKTVSVAWEDSYTIKKMKEKNQDFLYFIKENSSGTIECGYREGDSSGGEFALSDLEPYEKPSNLIELDRNMLLDLLERGFFKEDVRFYVSK